MLGYIKRLLQRFHHIMPKKPVNTPYKPPPNTYGKESQTPVKPNTSEILDRNGIKEIQQIVGAILYYSRVIDCIVRVGLSSIASKQSQATMTTDQKAQHLLDYLATHPEAEIKFHASEDIFQRSKEEAE